MTKEILETVGAKFLSPDSTRLFKGRLGSIHCVIDDQTAYANVYCKLCMPVRHPKHFISVWHTDPKDKERHIGIIEDPTSWPEETRRLVEASLARQYFERTITRILEVKWKYGLLFFHVETDEGPKSFQMRWQQERALEHGDGGKVLLDVYDNRYVIPDLNQLLPGDRDRLMRFIFW